jgi:hypothetical protein
MRIKRHAHVLADVSLPGLALPEAFASLDSRLESVMQLSVSKGSPEAQVVGLITVCEELKQLLKCAFIGRLASFPIPRFLKPVTPNFPQNN